MPLKDPELTTVDFRKLPESEFERALADYYVCRLSRELSNVIRKDVLTGRAKFGVSDDGKELYQVAMARAIEMGDWRADYYRGHTLLLRLGMTTPEQLLAQLYSDDHHDPFSNGRQMGGHYANRTVDADGNWLDSTKTFNLSSATSPTAGQMARGFGLAFASRVFRLDGALPAELHSRHGNEISWTEIGDASTSEGIFWETMNAAGVTGVPMVCTVVDDGFGISVPVELQTTKGSISQALAGLQQEGESNGIDIHTVKGWDYPALVEIYPKVARRVRKHHRAALIHVQELTQPNGHSTSGSHERYKSKERLAWEAEWDCLAQFRHYLVATGVADAAELDELDRRAKKEIAAARKRAWENLNGPLKTRRDALLKILPPEGDRHADLRDFAGEVRQMSHPLLSELIDAVRRLRFRRAGDLPQGLEEWLREANRELRSAKSANLLSNTPKSPLRIGATPATYAEGEKTLPGYEILQHFFTAKFGERPELFAFGEDVGEIGDVNQGFAGLQNTFGAHRVFDTGIREWSILGQAMGMAMRGLRPIAEIQYLDYIYYGLPLLTDDVATLRWRTNGMQACPLIVRTRGHRLEGVWHSGSYLAPLIGSLRGMHLCVPRNMVQAVGLYNTLLDGDDPALVIEVLNGYRLREPEPTNLLDFRVPLGVPERLTEGDDLTIVTYGACVRLCLEAARLLAEQRDIHVEVVDVQTLLPFDLEHRVAASLSRTNRLLIVDEDMPGGASAYLEREIIEGQDAFRLLDAPVKTLTATVHRPAYADDGNYVSKPQTMDIVEAAVELIGF